MEPNYKKYTLYELEGVCDKIDRQKYPERFRRAADALEKRRRGVYPDYSECSESEIEGIISTIDPSLDANLYANAQFQLLKRKGTVSGSFGEFLEAENQQYLEQFTSSLSNRTSDSSGRFSEPNILIAFLFWVLTPTLFAVAIFWMVIGDKQFVIYSGLVILGILSIVHYVPLVVLHRNYRRVNMSSSIRINSQSGTFKYSDGKREFLVNLKDVTTVKIVCGNPKAQNPWSEYGYQVVYSVGNRPIVLTSFLFQTDFPVRLNRIQRKQVFYPIVPKSIMA